MSRVAARPFSADDVSAAATLLAERHVRLRQHLSSLPAGFEQRRTWVELLQPLLENPAATGAVAERDGDVVGFLFGTQNLHAPDAFAAKFSPPRSVRIPTHGHAIAAGEDADGVYNALYAALAERWTDRGFFVHSVSVPTGDPDIETDVEAAWANLGFGRELAFAARATGPVAEHHERSIEVHQATSEDIEVVARLVDVNIRYHREPPMFAPYLRDIEAAVRALEEQALADPSNGVFIAHDGGRPVALHLLLASGFGPRMLAPERSVYLFEAVVEADARGGGIGTTLLNHTMAWAREQGYDYCTLHYLNANPSGRPFWLGHGFRPLEHTLVRHVDERIAWARAPEET